MIPLQDELDIQHGRTENSTKFNFRHNSLNLIT